MKFLTSLFLALAISAQAAPLTNTITYNWLDFGYQVDSVTNKPVKITPLEYSTIGSFFMVKTPRIYTNTFAGQCVVTNQQEGSYRVELATALGSITTFTSTIPATATGGTNYEATQFVTNFATNSGSTRSYSITVSDLRYPSTAGSNILFYTNAGRVTIAGTVVTGTSPTVASNYLAVTKLDVTNGTAYALTVSGLFNSTNMDAKISAASNTVHTALIATNTLLFTNIFSLNTAVNNNANNVTSISNRVIQAEVTNAVQQTALVGLTNSIATKQLGSAALTNLSAQVNVATNIIGAGFGLTVSSNNAGTWTITGATTNYIATTNGLSVNLTNFGLSYFDRIATTNIIVTNGADYVSITNGVVNVTKHIVSSGGSMYVESSTGKGFGIGQSSAGSGGIYTLFRQGASASYDEVAFSRSDNALLGMMTFGYGQTLATPAVHFTNANIYFGTATRNFNTAINPVNVPYLNARLGVLLPAATPFTAPTSLNITNSAHLWSDGTNLCIVFQNAAGTRTTNKVTMTAWP